MKIKTLIRLVLGLAVIVTLAGSEEITSFKLDQTESATYRAVSDAADSLISKLGWSKDDVKISHIDTTDAKFGQTVVYEFDIQVGENVIPVRLSEDVSSWKYLEELPSGFDVTLADGAVPATFGDTQSNALRAVLAPFQLSGPVELWIQDGEQLRLAVPHDVDAGVVRKVLLADGAIVTVEGAREISLERPLQLPLPLQGISRESGVAGSILALADRLRFASRTEVRPLLSLRIVGPTSLVASTSEESATVSKLKVKRLAPGAVELVSRQHNQEQALVGSLESSDSLSNKERWLWPLPSLNGSDARLLNLEEIVLSAVGPSVYKKGSFKLLKAKACAATFVQIEFQLEKKLADESFPPELWPEWRTKPLVQRLQMQVLAKVEGRQLLPVTVQHLKPYANVESATWRAAMGNVTHRNLPKMFLLPSAMTLDPIWERVME